MSTATVLTVILIAAVVGVLIGVVFAARRRSRSREDGEESGVGEGRGSEREEARGEEAGERVRALSEKSRERYEQRWVRVERSFEENPMAGLEMADRTVYDIMLERNFPVEGTGERARSEVVEDYTEAKRLRYGLRRGGGDDEETRLVIRRYRSIYERLLEEQ